MALLEGIQLGTAIGGPTGTIVGGVIGGALDLFSIFSGGSGEKEQARAEGAYSEATTKIQLEEAKAKKDALASFLSKMPTAGQALTESTGDLAFDAQYRALLENLGNVGVAAGARGQVGPGTSMALVGEQAGKDVGSFVDTQKEIASSQLGIYSTSVTELSKALEEVEDANWEREHGGLFGHGGFLGLGI